MSSAAGFRPMPSLTRPTPSWVATLNETAEK